MCRALRENYRDVFRHLHPSAMIRREVIIPEKVKQSNMFSLICYWKKQIDVLLMSSTEASLFLRPVSAENRKSRNSAKGIRLDGRKEIK